ncbi:MAG: phage DNA packaging protein J [Dongiaceae bacterium]
MGPSRSGARPGQPTPLKNR